MNELQEEELRRVRNVFDRVKGRRVELLKIYTEFGWRNLYEYLIGQVEWYEEKHKELGCVFGGTRHPGAADYTSYYCWICNEMLPDQSKRGL